MLHVDDHGPAEAPAVLFLHGFMGRGADWHGVTEALRPAFRCLAADLPGQGASVGLPDAVYTMEGAAQALIDLLDERGVARCAVVGYSMGGRLALYLAVHHPERVRRLVLESASPGLASAAERAARAAADERRARRLETGDFDAFLHDWYRMPLFASLHDHAGLAAQRIAARRQNDPAELARVLRGMGTGRQPALWERLAALPVATLALAGALDAKYVRLARRMATVAPCLRAVAVPGAGHVIHAEQPHRFLRLLRTFLNPDRRS